MTLRICLFVAALLATASAQAQSARIVMDGLFDDWPTTTLAHTDPLSDAAVPNVDFGRLWLTNDERYFFLRFETGTETLIQETNQIVLYLDTDDNPATGRSVNGIGAELTWRFGDKTGTFFDGQNFHEIPHASIAIVTAPTVSSTVFEVALPRNAVPVGLSQLFPGSTVRLRLEDQAGDDRLPDGTGGVGFTFDSTPPSEPLAPLPIARQQESDVRFLSYNIERDGVFDGEKRAAFLRLLTAIRPDVIGFQEILSHSAAATLALVEAALPSSESATWYANRVDPDLVLVSRFPITASFSIPGGFQGDANAAFVLDLQPWGTELLLLNGHPPCCRNDDARQIDIDVMMGFVRDAMASGGQLDIARDTPIVILGDMNLVGFEAQLNTLLTGDIVNEDLAGPDFSPDWDGSALADLMPRHVGLPMTFTWYNESSTFHPGRLDFMVYTDAVLEPANRFVLFTPGMDADSLAAHGLLATDATIASDHLPVVGDFRYSAGGDTGLEIPSRERLDLLDPVYPNPFGRSTIVTFTLGEATRVRVRVLDLLGREIQILVDGHRGAGRHEVTWTPSRGAAGLYFVRLETARGSQTTTAIRR